MEEQVIVKNSVLKIFRECGFAEPSKMTQRDFEFVSGEIEKKTGIVLSSTTLKRLANGEFSRLPQVATLNAIAKFLGSENWISYKAEVIQTPPPVAGKKSFNTKPIVIAVVGITIITLMAFFMMRTKGGLGNLASVQFSATRTTDNSLPNTVVFNYNIDDVEADSFFIQQSWDQNRRIAIYKNHYTVTDIYYEPGFHVAKLIANDSVIREVDVSIPTDRWMFYANEQKILYKTSYINELNFRIVLHSLPEDPGNAIELTRHYHRFHFFRRRDTR